MLYPIKVIDIELSHPLTTIENLDGYMGLQALVRLYGAPIGYVKAPIANGRCTAQTLSKLILEKHSWAIIQQLLRNGLATSPKPEGLCLEDLFDVPPPEYGGELPLVTVAVCTRDRTTDLALCLEAISHLDYPHLDILVIDNAPTSDTTKELVQTKYPHVRYVCEPRPGLDWARNRAIMEAKGEIIAYTDDDVVVDSGWVKALAQVFAENPEVMAVTGLVVPYELETEAQVLFEMYGGFGRGFERKWYRVPEGKKVPWRLLGTGQFGTGANMAYRRRVFEEIGYFYPALDVGTVTNGGGDLEMFFRIIKASHTLVYEPKAIVRHRHRRDYAKLKNQIANNGSLYSYFFAGAITYPDQLFSFVWLAVWWMFYWNIRRLLISLIHPIRFPRELILAEIWGDFIGLTRYQKACKNAEQIAQKYNLPVPQVRPLSQPIVSRKIYKTQNGVAVRRIDLSQELPSLIDLEDYNKARIFVCFQSKLLGYVEIENQRRNISRNRLIETIVTNLATELLGLDKAINKDTAWAKASIALNQRYLVSATNIQERLPQNVCVSIVLGTCDRPDDLRKCLLSLSQQQSPRLFEIIVVDNRPNSGITPSVVAEFPNVILVKEPRQGAAYARNAGIVASQGDIIITTDDDTVIPPDWLEKLIAPFERHDVMAVTGNVLPLELETPSQQLFEKYGGLSRGFKRFEVNGDWFESFRLRPVPTWILGGTANSAFRASIFSDPNIGLMDEALGPGMPSGVGEDSYLFYKILKAGHTIIYEPTAYVWHKHRQSLPSLRRQIYNYSKGHVSHNLTTFIEDKDWRGILQLLIGLPLAHISRIYWRIRGWSDYPISLVLLEFAGNLAGPWSLWQSHLRVKREGCSSPYIPISQRSLTTERRSNAIASNIEPETVKISY
ncbi:glycosyl transferase, group 2 family protein [Nostoc sp. NIES-3756]|uniref:glycosyltransferase family 2 protein n=1 Tax=Nostoc sp. NIES-3756 TaxID=1751286 RepID=UPI000720A42B|nr:glycosyltransferase [Nostoc sp. NIES-3756]BAT55522.1 glycosyl transferase, group 2 family protein [Nostoc sp. NIES-3756]